MKRRVFLATVTAAALAAPRINAQGMGPGSGAGPGKGPGPGPGAGQGPGPGIMGRRWSRERMYGTRLMTLEERQEHMQKMWNAKTVDERSKIRDEHRKLMLERAKQQNYKLEDKDDDTFSIPEVK